jgi:ubiquitin
MTLSKPSGLLIQNLKIPKKITNSLSPAELNRLPIKSKEKLWKKPLKRCA